MIALAALTLGVTTISAEAGCQGRRDTGTAVGAVGGGVVGNAVSHGSAVGTIAGAVFGGLAGNAIGSSGCRSRYSYNSRYERRPYYAPRVAFYYDRYGHRHYYR